MSNVSKIRFNIVQLQLLQKKGFNDALYSYRKSAHNGKKSLVVDDELEIVGARPAINSDISQKCQTRRT